MKKLFGTVSSIILLMGAGCRSHHSGGATASPTPAAPAFAAQFGTDLPQPVRTRVQALLQQAEPSLTVLDGAVTTAPDNTTVFAFGNAPLGVAVIPASDLASAGSEGFVVRRNGDVLAARGNALEPDRFGLGASAGNAYAAYALLEHLGFAFLHPLAPVVPPSLTIPASLEDAQSPRWHARGIHLHTMHPLELTDLLNGWGPAGTDDAAGWTAQLPEWDSFLEWMTANRQNRVEWVLLSSDSWADYADSAERGDRLKTLVDHAHAWGIAAGADAPIALQQQHTWRLVRTTGTLDEEIAQIHDHLDWLMGAGYDFFSTESGTSEFTHPDATRMLAWMNEAATYVDTKFGKSATIKIHTSTGQTLPDFTDPDTGLPLNFNFLPHYADARLGVMPHTVQMYSLDDPAQTYGNGDFSEIRRFMSMEAGSREVIWHPETAYWVSYDVDVPLFLPVYADRRLHDLQIIAADEDAGLMGRGAHVGSRIDGQMIFSSGWEWGYWLNDVITARAAWNPRLEAGDDAFAKSLDPVVTPFGAVAEQVRTLLLESVATQRQHLIHGAVTTQQPPDLYKRTGIGYLEGWETWDDVGQMLESVPNVPHIATQPAKLGLVEMRNPFHDGPDYVTELEPLLASMDADFNGTAASLDALVSQAPAHSRALLKELADGARMDGLRAKQVHALYDYAGTGLTQSDAWRAQRLVDAKAARASAQATVATREAAYRVPVARIASWRPGPTVYPYGYLWTAHSLHYWWRDEGKAVLSPASPCYMNVLNPVDVAFGEGVYYDLDQAAAAIASTLGADGVAQCLTGPATEPPYPPAGLSF